jgi:rubredoxin-NAD+ reductase
MAGAGIVIVGTGLAGYAAARDLRKSDKAARLTLVTADDGAYYSKPQLSASIASGKHPDSLVLKTAGAMAAELDADIRVLSRIVGADPETKTLLLSDGTPLPYDKLVLASGAKTRRADIRLEEGAPIHSVNDLGDYRRFRNALDTALDTAPAKDRRVVILGSGLIGCEFANDLALAHWKVTVVGNGAWPLQGLVPSGIGRALREATEKIGVAWKPGEGILAIEKSAGGWKARLRGGTDVEADLFLSAIGFDPNLELAKALGLETGRGVKVDSGLRTSRPDIYALGDCAEFEGRWLPFVLPINHAAKALGQVLAGTPTVIVFPHMPVLVKTPTYPIIVLPPPAGTPGDWNETVEETGATARFLDSRGRMRGFALGGSHVRERAAMLKSMDPGSG